METSTFGPITDWNEVIKKEVKGLSDADFGEVQEVNENYVLTQRGTISKEKFYLPKSIPHGFNGRIFLISQRKKQKRDLLLTNPHYPHQKEKKSQGFKDKTLKVQFLSLKKG